MADAARLERRDPEVHALDQGVDAGRGRRGALRDRGVVAAADDQARSALGAPARATRSRIAAISSNSDIAGSCATAEAPRQRVLGAGDAALAGAAAGAARRRRSAAAGVVGWIGAGAGSWPAPGRVEVGVEVVCGGCVIGLGVVGVGRVRGRRWWCPWSCRSRRSCPNGLVAEEARERRLGSQARGSRRRARRRRRACSRARSAPRGRRRSRAAGRARRGCRPRPRSRRAACSRRTRRRTAPRWCRSCPPPGRGCRSTTRCRSRACPVITSATCRRRRPRPPASPSGSSGSSTSPSGNSTFSIAVGSWWTPPLAIVA